MIRGLIAMVATCCSALVLVAAVAHPKSFDAVAGVSVLAGAVVLLGIAVLDGVIGGRR